MISSKDLTPAEREKRDETARMAELVRRLLQRGLFLPEDHDDIAAGIGWLTRVVEENDYVQER